MAGRRPKPTAIHVLNGNPSKKKLSKTEPSPTVGAPACPDWLDARAKSAWAYIVPELMAVGVLTVADGLALQQLCEAYADWKSACEIVAAEGILSSDSDGNIRKHPAVQIKSDADKRVRAWLGEFGLTPAARAKLSGGKSAADAADPWDSF